MDKYYIEVIERLQRIIFNQVNEIEELKKENEELKDKVEKLTRENVGLTREVENGYQMTTKTEYYDYIYPIFDNRAKPSLSAAALETLSIIAYNPKITRAEIEQIRGVNSDGTIYKLLEYNLIEEVGRLDAPGRPTIYSTTKEFLKLFRLNSIAELPKLDEDEQERFELAR